MADATLTPGPAAIAALIDHAILKPELTASDVDAELDIAERTGVFSVCVRPSDVAKAVARLAGTEVLVGTVIGFPHGTTSTAAKVAESVTALHEGARELDMVLHIGALRSGEIGTVEADIRAVVATAAEQGAIVKVILETVFLSDAEVIAGAQAAERAGAAFVKTSTGFAGGGATAHHIALMRSAVGPGVRIKASGGVRSLDTLLELKALGADRFGTSASATILADAERLAESDAARSDGAAVPSRIDSSSY